MIFTILKRALGVLMKKPFALWGISLLSVLLTSLTWTLFGIIPGLAIGIVLLISTSMTMIYLEGYRGNGVKASDLFFCFKDGATTKRVLGGMTWMYLWIFLWSLIPIAGPIFALVRAYEYRLTPYILVTEPEVSVTDAIKVSSQRTHGYKLQMWLADFAYVLLFVAVSFVLGLFSAIPVLGGLFALVLVVLTIAFSALSPLFAGLVQAAFYEEITDNSKFCGNCGQRLRKEAGFCSSCGTPVN